MTFNPDSVSAIFDKLMKLLNRLIVYFFSLLSVLLTIFSLAGNFGNWHRFLEITANFKLQYLLLSFCIFFFWLLTRRYYWLCLSLVCIVINAAVIIPWYVSPQQTVIDTEYESLRVLAFNVLHQNKRYGDAINLVKNRQTRAFPCAFRRRGVARQVDLATFLEATPPWDTELLALKKILPYHFSAPKLQIEIYSKYPLKNTKIKLYGTYRGLVISELNVGKSDLIFVATHAYPQVYFGNQGWRIRNAQLESGIPNELGKLNKPVIVGGDLNVTMWSPQYKSMITKSGLKNARQGFGILPTQSTYFPDIPWLAIPLDHFLVSQDILVDNFETGENIGSDHLPILIDVLIPSNTKS